MAMKKWTLSKLVTQDVVSNVTQDGTTKVITVTKGAVTCLQTNGSIYDTSDEAYAAIGGQTDDYIVTGINVKD